MGPPAAGTGLSCAHTERGFALSLAVNRGGASTPESAALRFVGEGSPPGYGSPSTDWIRETQSARAVLLRADDVWLHVVRLRDATWAVDSGGHCT